MKYLLLCSRILLFSFTVVFLQAQDTDWPAYGNDAGGQRYVPLQQINTKNIRQLKPVWTFRTGELQTYDGTHVAEKAAFEATPLMIDGTLYFSTPTCRVFAIDAATGKLEWTFNPGISLTSDYSEITSRGVSFWPMSGSKNIPTEQKRIFIATLDGRLIALHAVTGKPVYAFGNEGTVNLREGFTSALSITSPPAVIGNVIVVGSSMGDNQRIDSPKGTVRGYDAQTGKLLWSWDPVPRDSTDKAWYTWTNDGAGITGAANAWGVISGDAARDLVFIPTSSPSPDYYGGERKGQNLYGNCIMALRASTGKEVWHYQVVHHDLWDYDIAAQPMLIDIKKEGKKIPAVVAGTKMGFIFVLNRETGEPLFPVEERPVPSSAVPGEEASPTQPVPLLPEPLGIQHIAAEDAWGPTPADKAEAAARIARYHNEGNFTPPGFQGSLMTPGNVGGIHWGGMCYDPQNSLLVTNINRIVPLIRLIPRDKMAQMEKEDADVLRAETGMQRGTPYIMKRSYLFKRDSNGIIMQTKPPWGTLLAIDMRNGIKKWEVPLGYMLDLHRYPGAEKWGSLNFGGAITTAGNITFVAASMDGHLRAFDTRSGNILWEYTLPAAAQSTPMSYQWKGKQYIVICAGGHGKLGTRLGDYVMAFALPGKAQ